MSRQKILIIVLIISVAIFLFTFKGKTKKTPDTAVTAESNSTIGALNNDFVSALLGVQSITLDTGLLSSPVFKSLKPSGAVVSASPLKGKNDPFSYNGTAPVVEDQIQITNPRVDNFVNTGSNDSLLSGVKINFSKTTSSTTVVSITGLPAGTSLSVSFKDPSGKSIIIEGFTYKNLTEEYTSIVTGLNSKTNYTVNIVKPEVFNSIQANIQTK